MTSSFYFVVLKGNEFGRAIVPPGLITLMLLRLQKEFLGLGTETNNGPGIST